MTRVVEMKAGFVVHKLKIKCAPPRLFYTPLVVTFPVEMLIDPQNWNSIILPYPMVVSCSSQ